MKRPVGRPRKDRVKIGLSIYKEANNQLTELADKEGKTKSAYIEDLISNAYEMEKIAVLTQEELIRFWEEEKEVCEARIGKMEEVGTDQYFDLDAIGENR